MGKKREVKTKKKKIKLVDWSKCGRTILFIDVANVVHSEYDLGWRIDYKKLFNFFKKKAKLQKAFVYSAKFADNRQNGFFTVLKKAGFKLRTKPVKRIKAEEGEVRKANFDVELTIDALKEIDNYDALILFSGDSDFAALLDEIKNRDKKAIVFSTSHHIARELIERASKYWDIRKFHRNWQRKP